MKLRLLFAAICMLSLPMWFSPASGVKSNSTPYATVAIAGHTTAGGWCECGAPGCICDPGEEMTGRNASIAPDASPAKGNTKTKRVRVTELDFGSGAILIALALFAWSRMRA